MVDDEELDIYNVKRKQAEVPEVVQQNDSNRKKGKGPINNQAEGSRSNNNNNSQEQQMMLQLQRQLLQQQQQQAPPIPFNNYSNTLPKNINHPIIPNTTAKVVKKRRNVMRETAKPEVITEDTWEKLRKTKIELSFDEYMALNKKVARDVKEGIIHIHKVFFSTSIFINSLLNLY
ncbi:unnamed protein product [Mucor hiemalis]